MNADVPVRFSCYKQPQREVLPRDAL